MHGHVGVAAKLIDAEADVNLKDKVGSAHVENELWLKQNLPVVLIRT